MSDADVILLIIAAIGLLLSNLIAIGQIADKKRQKLCITIMAAIALGFVICSAFV